MSSSHASGERETVILGSSNGSIEVEAIGLDKVRGKLSRLDHLRAVSLGSESVAFPDPPGEIKKTCPSKSDSRLLIDCDLTRVFCILFV